MENNEVIAENTIETETHGLGNLPLKIKELNATVVIAGGIGQKATDRFKDMGIELIHGIEESDPQNIIEKYLQGDLKSGDRVCEGHEH